METVPRIESQKDAAAMLRITPRRLRDMETSSPWWVADMRTEEGYDVVGIAVAQLSYSTDANEALPAAEKDALKARQLRAETQRAEFLCQEAEVKAWRAQREKEIEQHNILPADVYSQFIRELLGMLRSRLDDLPYQLARQASAAQKPLIYVPENKQKKSADAAPLQKMIAKLQADVEEWLATDPTREEDE
jgi:hypothetical protein